VKAVQIMLGLASAVMNPDVYAGRFGDHLDAVADRLHEAAARARADCGLRPETRTRFRSLSEVQCGFTWDVPRRAGGARTRDPRIMSAIPLDPYAVSVQPLRIGTFASRILPCSFGVVYPANTTPW
jgi:hypothetical protein